MILAITPENNFYSKQYTTLSAEKLAVKTCIIRNQKSMDYIVLHEHYKMMTKIYRNMLYSLAQGKCFYLIFPKIIVCDIIYIEEFYKEIFLLIFEELKGHFSINFVEHKEIEQKYSL
ncbi:MAG: hypothetical protein ACRCVW_03375 [Brevinema sp.]